jgi:hypothetical protein
VKQVVCFALLGALIGLAACTEESSDLQPLKSSSSSRKKAAGDDDDPAPVPTTATSSEVAVPVQPIDAGSGGAATTYIGTLDATPTVRFGGSPYCSYDVTLKSVRIEVAALPSGEIIGASVTDTMVEASVPPCTYSPAPPSDCSFAFTTATPDADGYQLDFKGAASNHPATKLVVSLTKVGASYEAKANWHRTDQGAPLDWTVTTKITLGPR